MRLRYLGFLTVAVATVFASAAVAAPPERPLTGTLNGSATGLSTFCISGMSGTFSTTGTFTATTLGKGAYTGTVTSSSCIPANTCCGIPSAPYPIEATFTFSGRGGSLTASGSGTGTSDITPHSNDYNLDLNLTIESGTGRYRRATGAVDLSLIAVWNLQESTESVFGTMTGSISR